ncbi:MAG: hypothetical protein ACHQ2Y_04300 [Candidatus Lutacidiplasmatales archaeon]
MTTALACWMGFLVLLEAAQHPQIAKWAAISPGHSLSTLEVEAVVIAATTFVVWFFALPSFRLGPIGLRIDGRGAHFLFKGRRECSFLWSQPGPRICLHDIRHRTRNVGLPYPYEVWASKRSGDLITPLTVEAFETFLTSARALAGSVEPVGPTLWESLITYVNLPGAVTLEVRGGPRDR